MLTVQLSEVESVSEDFRKVTIDSTPKWKEISKLKVGPGPQDHRGSLQVGSVSVISEDSRRMSFFADAESQLTKILSVDSADYGDEEEKKDVRPEEVFTDKARAAMVVIGTKDIKESLDRKKAVEIFRKTPEARNAAIYFQQAKFLVHQGRYKEAIVFINQALQVDPERKEWLTERSLCYFKMLQPEVALKRVDEVLALDPKYFQALLLKGEILYSLWDLERAMLCFVEGRRLRPNNTECIRGVHKIRMALDEISAYRDATLNGKRLKFKSKRSKSAKERPTSFSPSGSLPKSATTISSRHLHPSKYSSLSDKSSSVFSYGEDINKSLSRRPTTAHVRRKAYKTRLELKMTSTSEARTTYESSKSAKRRPRTGIAKRNKSPAKLAGSEDWLNTNTGKLDKERTSETVSRQSIKKQKSRPGTAIGMRSKSPTKLPSSKEWLDDIVRQLDDDDEDETVCGNVSHQSHKNSKPRPKTAVGSRKKSPTKLTVSEIRLENFACDMEKNYPSPSLKSDSNLNISSGILESDDSSDDTSAVSLSSSVGDISEDDDRKPVRKTKSDRNLRLAMSKKISAEKQKPVSCIGPKITAALEEDKMFLESILKNKGLKRAKTSYTTRALKIAKDLHKFVAEREKNSGKTGRVSFDILKG